MRADYQNHSFVSLISVNSASTASLVQFPLLKDTQPDEFEALVEDIDRNGLQERVKLVQNRDGSYWLVDGRNRMDAMEALGWDDAWRSILDGGDPSSEYFEIVNGLVGSADGIDAYVLSLNVHRRHIPMNAEQRREWIAKVLRHNPGTSDRAVAARTNVDHKTVGSVRADLETAGEISPVGKTIGKDGKVRRRPEAKPKPKFESLLKSKADQHDVVPDVEAAAAPPAPGLNIDLWHDATDEQRCEFVRAVTPAAIVKAYGMPFFYRAMAEDQKEAIDAELERLWVEQEEAKARRHNVARDIGALS